MTPSRSADFLVNFRNKIDRQKLEFPSCESFRFFECCDGSFEPFRIADDLFFGFFKRFIFSVEPVPMSKSFSPLTRTNQLRSCEWVLMSTSAWSFSRRLPSILIFICFASSCVRVCFFQGPKRPSRQNRNPLKGFP